VKNIILKKILPIFIQILTLPSRQTAPCSMTWNRLEMKPSRRRLLVRLKILDVVPGGCWLILVSPQIGL
jgi:hypothetical protein